MPVFDPNNLRPGGAGAVLHATANLLCTLAVFQELCEVATAELAMEHLVIGIQKPPEDNDKFTLDELKRGGFQANIHPPVPSQSSVLRGVGSPSATTGGAFTLFLRYALKEGEEINHEERNKQFLGWHDCITALQVALINAAEGVSCPRLRGTVPECDGAFGELDETSAQGEYLWARFHILWGDEGEG